MDIETTLVCSDTHFPYHDKKAWELFLKFGEDLKPNRVIIAGDGADFYGLNQHGNTLGVEEKLEEEIDVAVSELSLLNCTLPNAEKIYLEGNHEHRLSRFIAKYCPQFQKYLSVETLLHLKAMGYTFIPYGPNQSYRLSDLVIRHEPMAGGENFANGTLKKGLTNVLFGHHHRFQQSEIVGFDGKRYKAISLRGLCDKTHPVMQYVKYHHQWTLGFAVIYLFPSGRWLVQDIEIIPGKKYSCFVNGKLYYT